MSSYAILLKSMCYGRGSCDSVGVVGIQQWFPKCAPWISKGSATISQGIRGYISIMASLKFTDLFN